MPVNKDALRRYRIIDRILADPYRNYTTQDIKVIVNRECDGEKKVELRMIQKDIKAIEEDFGKKIIRNAGRRGAVRYEDQSDTLFYQELTLEEETIIKEILRSLDQFDGLDDFTWLDLLKRKLELADEHTSFPYVSFSKNEGLQVPGSLLGRLFLAISRKTVIEVVYKPFGQSQISIKVHPYQLKQYNDRWFLLCCPLETKDFVFNPEIILNLALDRMKEDFQYVEEEDFIECSVDLKERFDEIVGVTLIKENEVEDIIFAVDDESLDYVRTKWMHTTQIEFDADAQEHFRKKYPSIKYMTFFSIACRENQELYARFSSYMDNIVLVEPVYMRERLYSFLNSASEKYKEL